MFPAIPAKLDCRRPAFRLQRAVTKPTVRAAGLEPADHVIGATIDPAFTWTTAVFGAETLVVSVGGAARNGARLLLSTAVDGAI